MFGLPKPLPKNTICPSHLRAVQEEQDTYDVKQNDDYWRSAKDTMNSEQRIAFDAIITSIKTSTLQLKTFLAMTHFD